MLQTGRKSVFRGVKMRLYLYVEQQKKDEDESCDISSFFRTSTTDAGLRQESPSQISDVKMAF